MNIYGYKLKLIINEINPEHSRELIVPDDCTFHQLHIIIQECFGFNYGKPYAFQFNNNDFIFWDFKTYPTNPDKKYDSNISEIRDFFKRQKKIIYTYDFDKKWQVIIRIGKKLKYKDPYPIITEYTGKYNMISNCKKEDMKQAIKELYENPEDINQILIKNNILKEENIEITEIHEKYNNEEFEIISKKDFKRDERKKFDLNFIKENKLEEKYKNSNLNLNEFIEKYIWTYKDYNLEFKKEEVEKKLKNIFIKREGTNKI